MESPVGAKIQPSSFTRLPGELRNQIWQLALRDPLGQQQQQLCFYKSGCWDPRRLTAADSGYDPDNEEHNLEFEFHHDRLDRVLVEVPLFFVNREARSFARAWIHKQGLQICFDKYTQSLYFVRPVNPKEDILYISKEQFINFLSDPYDRLFQPDLKNHYISWNAPEFRRLALPVALLAEQGPDTLAEVMRDFYLTEIILIVKADPGGLWTEGHEARVRQRWELESTAGIEGPICCWDLVNEQFQWMDRDSTDISEYPLKKLLEDACLHLRTELLDNHTQHFKIRLALAVRKF
ncbi:hypothetical protein BDW59DRAFT_163392 [Aspergillus cavernicola]|uniref:2EXR domain-containing protein n=1 Tax=Aspergillus cavernicola TaxID=176166 RepID=A0ABR4I8L3_9EURO